MENVYVELAKSSRNATTETRISPQR